VETAPGDQVEAPPLGIRELLEGSYPPLAGCFNFQQLVVFTLGLLMTWKDVRDQYSLERGVSCRDLLLLSFEFVDFECIEETKSDGENNRSENDAEQSKHAHATQDGEEDEKLV
jgi:hypothetical protein